MASTTPSNPEPAQETTTQDTIEEAELRALIWPTPKPKPSSYWLDFSDLYFGPTLASQTQPVSLISALKTFPFHSHHLTNKTHDRPPT